MRFLRFCIFVWFARCGLAASEHRGQVKFNNLPVPGATVIASVDGRRLAAITDPSGAYLFPDLPDGIVTIRVEMQCFATIERSVTIGRNLRFEEWNLQLLPDLPVTVRTTVSTGAAKDDVTGMDPQAADGLVIRGSSNNGATSLVALSPAFGNNRRSSPSSYHGNIGVIVDNSALDARSFSLTGQDSPKPVYNRLTGVLSIGGPMRIPGVRRRGPNFVVNYQWLRNRTAGLQTVRMPSLVERTGDLGQAGLSFADPLSGLPFPGNVIPESRISPQAKSLLRLYPLPNFEGAGRYNFQVPLLGVTHQDSFQARVNQKFGGRDHLSGTVDYQFTRSDSPNVFGFTDRGRNTGINTALNWRHTISPRLFVTLGLEFSRLSVRTSPYFADREDISGDAGITGNSNAPVNWGPPNLAFSSGIAGLSAASAAFDRSRTSSVSYKSGWIHGTHNVSFGADFRRQQFNSLSQQDPRGTFVFTGAATQLGASGSDFAGFLLGVPDTSSIAFGNADKYFRSSAYDAYVTDDWRLGPGVTVNAGVRWEYGSPITELYGRLVNLAIASGFTAQVPVVAARLSGNSKFSDSLVRPDKRGLGPRIGVSWRPLAGSSMVIRAGYGVYYNTSVYQSIATRMAQQPPLSNTLNVQNTAGNPLTLADGFHGSPASTSNTFAVDPDFRIGYAQNWQLSLQRDLPGALVLSAGYLGIKGTRGMQEFLPNTFPLGAVNPCSVCPAGFSYLTSNGNSTREAGQIQLRRRMRGGFAAGLQYVFSKSIDNSALGGRGQSSAVIAQNWLDLSAEKGLSNFDQRHLLSFQMQYSSGMGLGWGWGTTALKEWNWATEIAAGSGLPLTPVYLAAVQGTGVTGSLRPDYTGAPVHDAPAGFFLNRAAYAPPAAGHWGDAGRNSIGGPGQLGIHVSLGRTFRLSDRLSADFRIDSTNALNHVTFPNWNAIVTSTQFGLPTTANAMRSVQTTLRLGF